MKIVIGIESNLILANFQNILYFNDFDKNVIENFKNEPNGKMKTDLFGKFEIYCNLGDGYE